MATTKLWAIKGGGSSTGVVIKNMVDYVENPDKTTKVHRAGCVVDAL